MLRFIPPGYLSVEQAIYRFSEAAAPHAWTAVPSEEMIVWENTVLNFSGERLLHGILAYCLRSEVIMKDAPRMRYFYFRDALHDLRCRLHDGSVTAWCLDQENRFGRLRSGWTLPRDGQWFDGVTKILETGIYSSKEGSRRVMLYEGDVAKIEHELGEWALRLLDEAGPIGRDRRFAERVLREAHHIGERWPGLAELWALVRGFPECSKITRDEVEELRKKIDPMAIQGKGRPKKITK